MNHDVFISYSRADAEIADTICEAFDNAGISYWIDRGGITSGEAFSGVIVKAIRESKITVFISSVNSNVSEYTIKEIVVAFNRKKHIIPFCIDKEPFADDIEFFLCNLDRLAYYLQKEFAIQRLVEDVARLLNRKIDVMERPMVSVPKVSKIITDSSQCVLKIRPNLDCSVFIDEELLIQAPANKITKIPLNKGTFWLEFVNVNNIADKYACEYTITNQEEFLSVDLQSIAKKREIEELELYHEEERQKKINLELKQRLIERLKMLTENQDDFHDQYNEFRKIQCKWQEIKLIPQENAKELWRNYKLYSERFYDIIKKNNDFSDYDSKKNLMLKTALCETVESLSNDESDVISAFHQLQKLDQQWREIGPVQKELSKSIWGRFKKASTVISERYQSHLDGLKE